MSGKRVLILIDQATRDGVSQLLVARYLSRKGVRVFLCNQNSLYAMFERTRPHVFFCTWTTNPPLADYLRSIQHRVHLFLVDQEGGRMGEAAFKRSVRWHDGAKLRLARSASRLVAWGPSQARWLEELGVPRETVVVTGCPRLDPYLLPAKRGERRPPYVGVTLRADPFTSAPLKVMESLYESNSAEDGLSPSLPRTAKYEDWFWRILAETRHMFLAVDELSRRTDAPIVVRPGPWERYSMYGFLPGRCARATVEPYMAQHEYVGGAFAVIDASSAMGLEALLAGTPVISIVSLVPRLEEHVGGQEGTRLNSPYRGFYWQPKSFDELVDYALRARRGELALTPDPEGMRRYLWECHGWPPKRPASFQTADAILELLGLPESARRPRCDEPLLRYPDFKRAVYRRVPGATLFPKARLYWRCLFSRERDMLRRYHFFSSLYPYHAEVDRLFEALWGAYETAAP